MVPHAWSVGGPPPQGSLTPDTSEGHLATLRRLEVKGGRRKRQKETQIDGNADRDRRGGRNTENHGEGSPGKGNGVGGQVLTLAEPAHTRPRGSPVGLGDSLEIWSLELCSSLLCTFPASVSPSVGWGDNNNATTGPSGERMIKQCPGALGNLRSTTGTGDAGRTVPRQRLPRQGAGGQAGLGGRTRPLPSAPPPLRHGWRRPLASGQTPSTSSEGGAGGPGRDPPGLPAAAPVALETHLGGWSWHRCRPRCGASERGAAGDGPAPGSHHRDTGKEHPALPHPGRSGPGFPGHGGTGARQGLGSQGGPLPVCLAAWLPRWSPAPECLGLVSPAWLSYLLP